MLMDQSWTADGHLLHHVLNVLWEFQPCPLISGPAQLGAGRSTGEFGSQTVEEPPRDTTYLRAPQTHGRVKSAHWALGSCQCEGHGDLLSPFNKSVIWSSKCLILLCFLVRLTHKHERRQFWNAQMKLAFFFQSIIMIFVTIQKRVTSGCILVQNPSAPTDDQEMAADYTSQNVLNSFLSPCQKQSANITPLATWWVASKCIMCVKRTDIHKKKRRR